MKDYTYALVGVALGIGVLVIAMAWAQFLAWRERKRITRDRARIHSGVPGYYVPKPGMVPNPMLGYERNTPCWCGSGAKAKKCCLPTARHVVSAQDAEFLNSYLKEVGMK